MDISASINKATNGFISKRNIIFVRFILGMTLCIIATLVFPVFAGDTQAIPKGPTVNYFMPSNVIKVEYGLSIESLATGKNYFYSNQFGFIGGDGGYIGLQSNGSRVNGTTGQTAVFSVFGAGIDASPSANCSIESSDKNFDGYIGKEGTSCRIPFALTPNTIYTLTVERGSSDATGTWWTGIIVNQNTKVATTIASIKVYSTWSTLKSWTSQWTEYFGALPSTCADLPYTKVRFYPPKANNGASTEVSSIKYTTTGNCTNVNSFIQDNTVVQEMGANTVMTDNPVITTPPTNPTTSTEMIEPPISIPDTIIRTVPTITVPVTAPPVTAPPVTAPPVTVPPTSKAPLALPVTPTGISSYNNGCLLIFCSVTVKWNGQSSATKYLVTTERNAPVIVNTNSITIPWVISGYRYQISVVAISANGDKSPAGVARLWV